MSVNKANFAKLFVNNPDLLKIERYSRRFNPLKVMKIEKMEIRHSAILGWLLDPNGNHGLGDDFLRSFLAEATREAGEAEEEIIVDALEVIGENFFDAEIFVEWNNIDILVRCPSAKWVFIIENKVRAKQGHDQLKKYHEFATGYFKTDGSGVKIQGIFLTKEDEKPNVSSYARVTYGAVYQSLIHCMVQRGDALASNVSEFINYYIDTVSEICGMSTEEEELKQLAKKLFREHRDVIEFIYEHGNQSEFHVAVQGLGTEENPLKSGDEFKPSEHLLQCIRIERNRLWFIPTDWINKFGRDQSNKDNDNYLWKGCEKWQSNYPVACFVASEQSKEQDVDLKLVLKCEVGPLEDHALRTRLMGKIRHSEVQSKGSQKFGFQDQAWTQGKKYSTFLRLQENVTDQHDVEKIEKALKDLFQTADNFFSSIGQAISSFVDEHETNS